MTLGRDILFDARQGRAHCVKWRWLETLAGAGSARKGAVALWRFFCSALSCRGFTEREQAPARQKGADFQDFVRHGKCPRAASTRPAAAGSHPAF